MEINQNRGTDDLSAARIAKMESELLQIRSSLDAIVREGAKHADLIRWSTDIDVAISKSTTRILMFILTLIILSHAVYPIIYACP